MVAKVVLCRRICEKAGISRRRPQKADLSKFELYQLLAHLDALMHSERGFDTEKAKAALSEEKTTHEQH
jgi:hypothetical protein